MSDSFLGIDISKEKFDVHLFKDEQRWSGEFENSLKELAQYFEQHYGPLRLVFLLDEVEAVTRFAWHETLFDSMNPAVLFN